MVVYGCIWLYMVVYGCIWLYTCLLVAFLECNICFVSPIIVLLWPVLGTLLRLHSFMQSLDGLSCGYDKTNSGEKMTMWLTSDFLVLSKVSVVVMNLADSIGVVKIATRMDAHPCTSSHSSEALKHWFRNRAKLDKTWSHLTNTVDWLKWFWTFFVYALQCVHPRSFHAQIWFQFLVATVTSVGRGSLVDSDVQEVVMELLEHKANLDVWASDWGHLGPSNWGFWWVV